MKMFTVYDSKAEAYLQPFFAQATGSGIRSFEAAANESGHTFERFGADYTLFEIGEFDEHTGDVSVYESKVNLGLALTFRSLEQPDTRQLELAGKSSL